MRSCQSLIYSRISQHFIEPEGHYHVHKSPPLDPIISKINPFHTTPSSLRSILILSTHLHLGLPSDLFFPAGLPINILLHSSSPHLCYMPCPSPPPWLDHSNYTWWRLQVMQFAPTYSHLIPLQSKYSPQHTILKYLSLCCISKLKWTSICYCSVYITTRDF
jgi:hypothetical protein